MAMSQSYSRDVGQHREHVPVHVSSRVSNSSSALLTLSCETRFVFEAVEETGGFWVCLWGDMPTFPVPPLLFISTSDDRQGQQGSAGHASSGANSYLLTFVFTRTFTRERREPLNSLTSNSSQNLIVYSKQL